MTPETLNFSGNVVTFFGLAGVLSTFVILVAIYRSYWASPYRR